MSDRAWTPGPLAAFGEHRSEFGEFVIAVRETNPRGQIAGYPTPTARYRNKADAQLGALAPEMAEAILNVADEARRYGEQGGILDAVVDLAERLRIIGGNDE